MNLPDCHITQRVRETHVLSLRRPRGTGTIVGFDSNGDGHRLPIVLFDGEQTGQPVHQSHLAPVEDDSP